MKIIIALFISVIIVELSNAQMPFTRAKAYDLVERFQKDGFITKIDLQKNEVQVDATMWSTLKLDTKRTFVRLIATYHGYKESQETMLSTDILDNKTGKKFGSYSIWSGVKISSN